MRQIEKEMLRAVGEHRAWSKDNTRVEPVNASLVRVFLHENHIADCHPLGIEPNRDTLAQWPTPTTKSRLRALGVNVTQSRGVVAIDGEVVCHV